MVGGPFCINDLIAFLGEAVAEAAPLGEIIDVFSCFALADDVVAFGKGLLGELLKIRDQASLEKFQRLPIDRQALGYRSDPIIV